MCDDKRWDNTFILYCEHGYNLVVECNGVVRGSMEEGDPCQMLVRESGEKVGLVRLKGVKSSRYVCFTDCGKLYGEESPDCPGTIWEETFAGSYTSYRSVKYFDWYLGIKKNGDPKKGYKTKWGRRSTKWLPRF